jgi:Tfp pilus assembly protein PilN
MNLIPEDYKRYLQQLLMLQRWGLTVLAIIVISASISFALNYRAEEYQKEIVVLEKKKAISSQQRNLLQNLQKDYDKLRAKHNVLEKLRGGALAKNMFVTVDRALEGNDVWFKNWRFDRAGSKTKEVAKTVNTGYFIVIPVGESSNKKTGEAWKIQTRMEVNGEAKDHEALASFVRRLLRQSQIGEVRILDTRQQTHADITVVNFKLAIIVNSRVSNS